MCTVSRSCRPCPGKGLYLGWSRPPTSRPLSQTPEGLRERRRGLAVGSLLETIRQLSLLFPAQEAVHVRGCVESAWGGCQVGVIALVVQMRKLRPER